MMIVSMLRVRNEELLIEDTVEHHLSFADQIIMLDDASTDETISRALSAGGSRLTVINNMSWSVDRQQAETVDRRRLLAEAKKRPADWFIYMDADERFESSPMLELESLPRSVQAVRFRLFDAYLTEGFGQPYVRGELASTPRLYGPEYRSILMAWRPSAPLQYLGRDQREPVRGLGVREFEAQCRVQHFGKAVSVDQWEATCTYYAEHFPEPYRSKWLARRGRPFHSRSVEGRPLEHWPIPPERQVKLDVAHASGPKHLIRRLQANISHKWETAR